MSATSAPISTSAPKGVEVSSPQRVGSAHRSLRDVVIDTIREAIVYGQYQPGDRLVEDKLAEELAVSRNPIREALLALEGEGLVKMVPRKGATVAHLSEEETREIVELQAALEGLSARLAARRCTPDLGRRITELLDRGNELSEKDDHDALEEINREFHTLVAEAGANRYLAEFMKSLHYKTYWLFGSAFGWRAGQSWKEHTEISRAILAGDEDLAAILVNRHVLNVGGASLGGIAPRRDFQSASDANGDRTTTKEADKGV